MTDNQIDFELELDMQSQVTYTPQTQKSTGFDGASPSKEIVKGYEVGFVYYVRTYENGKKFVYRISELLEKSNKYDASSSATERHLPPGPRFEIKQASNGRTLYRCKLCGKTFVGVSTCKSHINSAHINLLPPRKTCSSKTNQKKVPETVNLTKPNHLEHQSTISLPSSKSSSPVPSFQSTTNGKSKKYYELPHHCEKCGQGFNFKYKLKRHIENSDECYEFYNPLMPQSTSKSNDRVNGLSSRRRTSRIRNDESS